MIYALSHDFSTPPLPSISSVSIFDQTPPKHADIILERSLIMEVIELDQLKDTNNKRLKWAMPHSGLKPKNENVPKEEDDLWWKKTFWWKTIFDRRRPLTENDLCRKTTFVGRQPLMEDDLRWKTTFNGRQPSIGCIVYYLKKCLRLLTLTVPAQLTQNWKSCQLSKPDIEFHVMEEMYAALCMCMCAEKTTFLGKDD